MPTALSTDQALDHRVIAQHAPYITSWSSEHELKRDVVECRSVGIAYTDECVTDRDDHGVLWCEVVSRPRQGRPQFGRVHPLRQRRAMRRLLCQVCGSPADQNDDGVLWLLQDHHDDWPSWPERMGSTEPPVCAGCVPIAMRLCPAMRQGAVAFRVCRYPIIGVRGMLYHREGKDLIATHEENARYDDPTVRWMRAVSLIRELRDCTIVPLEDLCPSSTAT